MYMYTYRDHNKFIAHTTNPLIYSKLYRIYQRAISDGITWDASPKYQSREPAKLRPGRHHPFVHGWFSIRVRCIAIGKV